MVESEPMIYSGVYDGPEKLDDELFGDSFPPVEQRVVIDRRPPLAFRVGITGARVIDRKIQRSVYEALHDALLEVRLVMEKLAKADGVTQFYKCDEGKSSITPHLCMVSPLARGADRQAAWAATDLGYELRVAMPFARDEYRHDFTGYAPKGVNPAAHGAAGGSSAAGVAQSLLSQYEEISNGFVSDKADLAEFDQLLKLAQGVLELDGERGGRSASGAPMEAQSYEGLGHYVVRHSDLLIAVWDGEASRGRGGAAEIVAYAAKSGVPIWWIDATGQKGPQWIADIQDLRDPKPGPECAKRKLHCYLKRVIPAPEFHGKPESWFGKLAHWGSKEISLALRFFEEWKLPERKIWKTFDEMKKLAADQLTQARPSVSVGDPEPKSEAGRYWRSLYTPADQQSVAYGNRYRSTYVLVIALTTLALALGAVALWFAYEAATVHGTTAALVCASEIDNEVYKNTSLGFALSELLTLVSILSLVIWSLRKEWQERLIEYRLLAELYRKQEALAPLGWALSIGAVQHVADSERLAWVSWLFAAMQRAAPMQCGVMTELYCEGRNGLLQMVDGQITYHGRREITSHQASMRLENFGAFVFMFLIACVALKIRLHIVDQHPWSVKCGLLAMVLPGVSAAFVAMRNYAEFQMLAEQSRSMCRSLETAKSRIQRIGKLGERGLMSQDLGSEAAAVATVMMEDLQGWGRLFRGKEIGG